ncbi:MAG: hypothetical protein LC648_02210 [Novosphingobium sp.]|nr:hypothetical protein [Novosphingobium sp.]
MNTTRLLLTAWAYRSDTAGTYASFGPVGGAALLGLRCETATSRIVLSRAGQASGPLPINLVTTSLSRSYSAVPAGAAQPLVSVSFAPRDAILDAMAFSRGRFMVEVPGLPTLYLPAWPEAARVIEDCR